MESGVQMAEEKAKKQPRRRKAPKTVREHAEKQQAKKAATPRRKKLNSKIHKPLSVLSAAHKKEYHPVPLPDNKVGKILGKRVIIIPKFIKNAWAELKLVTWPTRSQAARLTVAVIVFSTIFAIFVQILDLIFSRLVKEILL
jgi:preprotein translocase subunit SecE